MGKIILERIYDKDESQEVKDGFRILVDRLWPRGVSKERADLDLWAKDFAPTNDLRKWFNHIADRYPDFKSRYQKELDANPKTPELLSLIDEKLKEGNVVFLYGARDREHNEAVVLKDYVVGKLGEM
ncbi:DUF488 family protein [Streptococcaceae bacterium ESL0729]|nr:DUF488 family protein [Streptococcaceae bacterium ESL0729]